MPSEGNMNGLIYASKVVKFDLINIVQILLQIVLIEQETNDNTQSIDHKISILQRVHCFELTKLFSTICPKLGLTVFL